MSEKAFLDYEGLERYNARIKNEISKIEQIPPGVILAYGGETIPIGWAICDGQNGTPDLRGRFILGSNDEYVVGSTGGSESHALTIDELPQHSHTVSSVEVTESLLGGSLFSGGEDEIAPSDEAMSGETGQGDSFDIMPPYYVLVYIMKLPST